MLTDRQIQAALKSTKPEVVLNDGAGGRGTGSLKLVIRGGRATWFAFWKQNGQRQKKQLGRYPDLGLKEARDRYSIDIRSRLVDGKNPRVVTTKTDKPTVERMFQAYVDSLREAGKVSADEIQRALLTGKYAAADGLGRTRNASDVEPAEVRDYLAKAYDRGSKVSADRTRTYMVAAYNWALQSTHDYTAKNAQDWGIKSNPVAAVKKDATASKAGERNLSAGELKKLWHGVDHGGFYKETAALLKLVICCGQRVQETLRVEGHEIDFDSNVWNMPAAKTKGKKQPHTIPLPALAVDIFRDLVAVHGDGHLFPARQGSSKKLIAVASLSHAVMRWCDEHQFKKFTPRDLRRTWKSRTADAGIDRFVRDLIQQHAKGDTGSKFYDRADYLPLMREAMNQWNEWLIKTL
jgi:integrase